MITSVLVVIEAISAVLGAALTVFMIKPYLYTGEKRYIGLPLGFAFLSISYIFQGIALSPGAPPFIEDMKWLHLFTQAYAFIFLAVTYYFSKQTTRGKGLLWQILFSILIIVILFSYIAVSITPFFTLPSYKSVDEYFRSFNIIFALYLSISTLRSHALKPDSKTIWAPLGYILLAFSQYSFLIWSLDLSMAAFVGAHILRLMGLLIFLYISFETFRISSSVIVKKRA